MNGIELPTVNPGLPEHMMRTAETWIVANQFVAVLCVCVFAVGVGLFLSLKPLRDWNPYYLWNTPITAVFSLLLMAFIFFLPMVLTMLTQTPAVEPTNPAWFPD